MNIIIVGAGKIGSTIASHLSQEDHNITIIDSDPDVIESITTTLDVIGVVGNGASAEVLREANVADAKLLIAVTNSDELNILSCFVSKNLGVQHTMARIRKPEYYEQLQFLKNALGLSMIINPDLATAIEVSRMLNFPSAAKIESFSKGRVEIVQHYIDSNNILCDTQISKINKKISQKILICAVERNDEVFIPNGNFVLKAGDTIHFTASSGELTEFYKTIGNFIKKSRNALIIGGGRIAYYLAQELAEVNISTKIVERNAIRSKFLNENLEKATIINGDGSDQDLLLEEGIDNVDAFVCLTGSDEENVMISLFAKTKKVDKIITKVNRDNYNKIVKDIGLESIISPKIIVANQVSSYVRAMQTETESIKTLYKLMDGKLEAIEFVVPPQDKHIGIEIKNLKFVDNLLIACITRKNKIIFPDGNFKFEEDDSIVVVTTAKKLKQFEDIFA